MSFKNQIVQKYVDAWRNLRAWGRSLDNVDVCISNRTCSTVGGWCKTYQQAIMIYQGPLHWMLLTVLHEYAHAVEISDHHDTAWQARFAAAVTEVTGVRVVGGCEDDYNVLNSAAEDAIKKWWPRTADAFAAKLLKVS